MKKKKVVFLCVHNSCRSQIAEALMKNYGSHVAEVYSAGTALKNQINPDAVRLMKALYGIDMEKEQTPKLMTDIPAVEQVITMGCNVSCPSLPYQYDTEDWGLDDPTGKSDQAFIEIISEIDEKVNELIKQLEQT
ncbi:arsenate reductase ArsC [Streptococcus sp. CSL10205-OR2]|uniref:arsenate reductase ArsC n=1 Tax=Streptococcus sp. CSL10205-OR2 TaxID=2980558 RepID=UPI0021D9E4EF|nr:arsenate reductase ArsC [Streptococcus sp. CSL10205-OR2]MCU9533685.1 arsenate reductase ArsC [Streptococcus sp. CSL10205-OR2]